MTKTIRYYALLLLLAAANAWAAFDPASPHQIVINPNGTKYFLQGGDHYQSTPPYTLVGTLQSYSAPVIATMVPLTAAEIASPSASILASRAATYYLNVAPYTRYQSDGSALAELAGDPAAADITDAGAVGIDLLQAITDTDAFNAMSFGSHAEAFLQADGNVLARTALGAQTVSPFLTDITAAEIGPTNGWFLKYNGTNLVLAAVPGGGDALVANTLAQFAATTSAQLFGIISDETGSAGGLVRATSPTITTPTLSGVYTMDGAVVVTSAAMGALEVNVAKYVNTKTIAAPATLTFSATPATGTEFGMLLANSDTSPHLITLPANVYSFATNATMASFVIPASSVYYIQWRYNGTVYRMSGEPRAADNFVATAAPTVNDDVSLGYAVGSKWTNVTLDVAYECIDATDGAAIWRRSSSANEERIVIAISDETTAHTTGTAKVTFRMPFAMTLTSVRGSLTTASSSGIPTWDINEGGTTVISTKLTIDANEKTSTTAAVAAVISDSALADDAEITIDIDTAGTGAAGGKVTLIGYRP